MNSVDDYVQRIKQLALAHNDHFKQIAEDGVIDYGESLSTRELLRSYQANLQIIKREAARDLREIHTRYSEKILVAQHSLAGAERAEAIHDLQQEQQHIEDAYSNIIERADFLLVGIPQNSRLIEDHITDLEQQMNSVFDDVDVPDFEDITAVFHALEDQDSIADELLSSLSKWRTIHNNIEERIHAQTTQSAEQRAYEVGVMRALELVINDVEEIVDLIGGRNQA